MRKTYEIHKRWSNVLDFFFPRHCPICDEIIPIKKGLICEACKTKAKHLGNDICVICNKEVKNAGDELCEDCRKHKHFFVQNFGVFTYASMAESIYRFKYKGRQEYADFYGEEIVQTLGEVIRRISPDALIPVPLHKSKMRTRGFNQAELIAKAVGRQMGIPVYSHFVIRTRKTTPQKELSREERQNNLKRAFKIAQNDVKLNTIIVIDDIYTTGSTIDMVSKACLEAGVAKVYGICLSTGRGN